MENKESFKIVKPIISIYFKTDKSNLSPEAQIILDSIANILNHKPSINIKLKGYTSKYSFIAENRETSLVSASLEKRSRQYSIGLSERYSKSVAQYFISKGINRNRIVCRGYGIDQPKYKLDLLNNRVEISLSNHLIQE